MSETNGLPKSWITTTVEHVAKSIQYGHTASAVDNHDGPRFLRITDIQDNKVDWNEVPSCEIPAADIDKYRLQSGDIVFARTGATTGKSFLIRDCPSAVFASYLIRLRMRDGIFPPFIQAYFQTNNYWRQIEGGKRGIGQPNVNATVLGTITLPLAPPNEQRRIVAKMEELFSDLDAGVAALERARANLKRYRASVIKTAVEGKLTEEWRAKNTNVEPASKLLERILAKRRKKWEADQLAKFAKQGKQPPKGWKDKYVEPKGPDTSALPELPMGWCWCELQSLAEVVSGFAFSSQLFGNNGVPVVKIANIGYGVFELHEQEFLPDGYLTSHADFEVVGNTILLALTRPITDNTLKVCYYPTRLPPALLNQRVAMVRPVETETRPFLYSVMHSQYFRDQIQARMSETLQPNLSPNELKIIPIPFAPLAEQQIIVKHVAEKLSQIEAAELAIDHGLQRSARLRQSILKRAFEGKLVPQDPNDEPAGEMLKRVRQENIFPKARKHVSCNT